MVENKGKGWYYGSMISWRLISLYLWLGMIIMCLFDIIWMKTGKSKDKDSKSKKSKDSKMKKDD